MTARSASGRLRELLAGDGIVVAPGVFDGLSAGLAEQAGFQVIYASGGAIARSAGLPDLGLLSFTEVATRLEMIVERVSAPVVADADSGYGNALNVRRAVRHFQRAGVAALHLEDQVLPKRCGHYDDKQVVPFAEMVQKLRAARDEAAEDLVIIARTDALAVEGEERTIERCHRYMEAGADMLFVEAPRSEEQIVRLAQALDYPMLINMFSGGKTPMLPLGRLAELGYRLVIVPGDLQRAAIVAMENVLAAIYRDGDSSSVLATLASFKHREEVVDTEWYLEMEKRYAS